MPPAQKGGGRTGKGRKRTGGMTGSKGKFPHQPATPRGADAKNETTSVKADLIGGERQSEGQEPVTARVSGYKNKEAAIETSRWQVRFQLEEAFLPPIHRSAL